MRADARKTSDPKRGERAPPSARPADELRALQQAVGNRAVGAMLGRKPAPKQPAPAKKPKGLPPVRVQPDSRRWGEGSWKLEFEEWVFSHALIKAVFVNGELPPGFTLEPTRKTDSNPSLYWTLTWKGRMSDHEHELTSYGKQLRSRASGAGEELAEDRWRREGAAEQARIANREHNKTHVPALGMTGEEALRTLKPGVYVAAPGLPLRPLPAPNADDSLSDVSWMRRYKKGGVFVWVGGTTAPTRIRIREIGKHEQFWKWMVWYLQRGRDIDQAEREYIALWDELNRMMIGAFAMALTSAPRIGPRQNVIKPTVRGTPSKPGSAIRQVDPLQAVETGLQVYGGVQTVKDTIRDAEAREAVEAHARGDLYQLPVLVEAPKDEEPAAPPRRLQRAPRRGAASKRGAGKARLTVRERVDRFVNQLASTYQAEIAAARKADPKATHSKIGLDAEKATLKQLPDIANQHRLNPDRIWVGDFPAGVTGPKGGVITAEVGSVLYNFMIELKKSPRAVRRHQAQAQLIGIEFTVNFNKGRGRYFRIYGERFDPGKGIYRYEAPPKPPKPRAGRR